MATDFVCTCISPSEKQPSFIEAVERGPLIMVLNTAAVIRALSHWSLHQLGI